MSITNWSKTNVTSFYTLNRKSPKDLYLSEKFLLSKIKKDKIKKILRNRDNAFLIENETENLREYLKEFNNGIPLWFNCIIFSLFFLFLETILIRIL